MIWIDMEMPDNCYCCILCRHVDMFCRRLGKFLDRDDCYDERDRNCPLHEVTADPDTVSRKAVLDAVNALTKWSLLDRFDRHVGVGVKYYEVKEAVKNLPPSPSISQEPQIHCNKCKHYQGVHDVQGHAPCSYWKSGSVLWNEYCSHAEPYKRTEHE